METAEGVGSVAVPGGEPLHGGFHAVNYPVDPAITVAAALVFGDTRFTVTGRLCGRSLRKNVS